MNAEKSKKVILAIDDVSMSLALIKSVLSDYFDVRLAKSGELALFILGSVKVDLILLDIEMPNMSGFDFMDILQQIPEAMDIPIIFVTSHARADVISQAIRSGAKDYVIKPIVVDVLKQKVFKVLDMPIPE